MRIAILEDDADLGQLIATVIVNAGHHAHVQPDCRSMLKALRQESFDLLLLDWQLPDGSGVEVLRWAHEHCDPCPPVIMVTARSNAQDIVEALEAGADDFIVKPIDLSVLHARVSALLRRSYREKAVQPARSRKFTA